MVVVAAVVVVMVGRGGRLLRHKGDPLGSRRPSADSVAIDHPTHTSAMPLSCMTNCRNDRARAHARVRARSLRLPIVINRRPETDLRKFPRYLLRATAREIECVGRRAIKIGDVCIKNARSPLWRVLAREGDTYTARLVRTHTLLPLLRV